MNAQSVVNDIKLWLEDALAEEQLTEISVDVLGNSEKGDGYSGDVVFVNVKGKTFENKSKTYDLVLKCSKKSQTLRDSMPIKDIFENEIYLYSQVFPVFRQFQTERNVESIFDSVAKYYGKFASDNREVVVLQNLKALGYKLYDRKMPLTLNHIKLVIGEYGKWHAISAAMQDQQPEMFRQLVYEIKDIWRSLSQTTDVYKLFGLPIKEIIDLIQGDISENIVQKLQQLENQAVYITQELIYDQTHFSVIVHGDCWNNNFMFKYDDTVEDKPVKVAMLDWQISKLATPVLDLSLFLYTCISPEDLKMLDDILKEYHTSFSYHLKKLGSDPEKIFPFSKLLEDWKFFSKYGILMALAFSKAVLSDSDEVQDVAEVTERGGDMSDLFRYEIKDKTVWKRRVLNLVTQVAELDLF